MPDKVTMQAELDESTDRLYEMERRLFALKSVYAENPAQKRDERHSYASRTNRVSLNNHGRIEVSPEERYRMIAKEAYVRSKRHGFEANRLAQDWMEAEADVDDMLRGNQIELPEPHHDAALHGHE